MVLHRPRARRGAFGNGEREARRRLNDAVGAAAHPPVRGDVLDPVPRRVQRQPLQERARDPRHVPGARRVGARAAGSRCRLRWRVHPPLLPLLRNGRAARGQVPKAAAGSLGEGRRDRLHGRGGGGLSHRAPRAAPGHAVPDGPALDLLRPGEIQHPAPAPRRRRAGRWKRAHRDRDFSRHPDRDHRRRRAGGPGRGGAALAERRDRRRCRHGAPGEPAHPSPPGRESPRLPSPGTRCGRPSRPMPS